MGQAGILLVQKRNQLFFSCEKKLEIKFLACLLTFLQSLQVEQCNSVLWLNLIML